MKKSKLFASKHLNGKPKSAPLTEWLEPRTMLSAGFIYDQTEYGPRASSGIVSVFTPSGLQLSSFGVDPAPQTIDVVNSNVFILTYEGGGGIDGPDTPAMIAEFTRTGATVNDSLISGLNNPQAMAISGSDIFVTLNDGTVAEYSTGGATLHAALISGLTSPGAIAVSGSDLFVQSTASDESEQIGEYTLTGSPVNTSLISGLSTSYSGFATNGSDLFVMTGTGVAEYTTSGSLVNSAFIASDTLSGINTSGSDIFVGQTADGVVADRSIDEYNPAGTLVQSYIRGQETGNFAIAPAAAANATGLHLNFEAQPDSSNLTDSSTVSPDVTVSLLDQDQDLASDAVRSVTLSIASGPAGATLTGVTTVPLVNGTAVFDNISVSPAGNYAFTAFDGTDLSAISASGYSAVPQPYELGFQTQTADVPQAMGTIAPLVVTVLDQNGDTPGNLSGDATISIASGPTGATLGGTLSVPFTNGQADFDDLTLSQPGVYTLQASDGGLYPSATTASFVVFGAAAALTIESSQPAVSLYQPVTFTATVAPVVAGGPAPGGTVMFTNASGDLLGTSNVQSNGTAVFSTTYNDLGAQSVSAFYSGDTTYSPAAAAVSETITTLDPQLSLTNSPASFAVGQPVTFTATVSSVATGTAAPTGTIEFTDQSGDLLDSTAVPSTGLATFTTTFIQPGEHTITATYSGDSLYSGASASVMDSTTTQTSVATLAFKRVVLPASVVLGVNFKSEIPAVVSNNSTAALKGVFNVNLYAEPTGGADGSQILITTFKKSRAIGAHQVSLIQIPLHIIPATLPAGSYKLLIEIFDPKGSAAITTLSNSLQLATPVVHPVLSVSGVSPVSIIAGKSGYILVTISNQGNIVARGIDLSISGSVEGGTPVILGSTSFRHASIKPSATLRLKIRFKIPRSTTHAAYLPVVDLTLDGVAASATGTTAFMVD
jgi:hypothetical protein